ncbi:type I DNA topoisomerase [Salinibacter ruber]|uniref:DNA topoisomerase 1 n=1 Tax=Salinibacter ruber TaxID=146919 RepID=A0A9X2ZSI2_9BACT|nr:type I DNA topoisomerase [Salinibacter ruber]MCS3952415.1 DNA topoisomerase-1 [Salinibacter ruber]MCS4118864.1 DNA topoisomerase-1 [Salinibacter ruber]MCS4155155.1 DNA topoisomerase-1 [Salinibacter ruber]MCS4171859.1 DNA topoisomerase-1 [Salinibacter ruber]MCS4188081.1 DNA topoisomerase-1 [Salinibacter ruber]
MKRLVVVESPTKARTIREFLPETGYRVEASMGHIRDLPASADQIPSEYKDEDWSRLGVKVTNGFEPLYVVPPDKKEVVRDLKQAVSDADRLYIATDEDREGESIGWHLIHTLDPDVPVERMVFHEITEDAIQRALEDTRDIDQHLVEAQQTRRILDRLVGYSISPLLWRKIKPKLSAGRVQSVAVRLLVQKERERITFVPATYWDLDAQLAKQGIGVEAEMTHLNEVRLASGKDFDEDTGRLKESLTEGEDVVLLDEEQATALAEGLPETRWRIDDIKERTRTKSPFPPFITSTLQQEANRKLNLSSSRTMSVAQSLYENGYITYMRTDSTNLSSEAVEGARRTVAQRYGDEYLSDGVRQYSSSDSAQEAHEAIRPAGSEMKTKDELGLSGIEAALYDLIWKRMLATQTADAKVRYTNVYFDAEVDGDVARFRASGKRLDFPGFFRVLVEGSEDPEAALRDQERPLPPLEVGETAAQSADDDGFQVRSVEPLGHETKPPSRYTEASLVETLEEEGIGRPSTYASIIGTIQQRGYARMKGSALVPTFTAFATNNLMETQFEPLVDVHFTAEMEDVLDDIARGRKDPTPYLRDFYKGEEGVETRVEQGLDDIDPKQISEMSFPDQWGEYVVRVGKYGAYVEGEMDGATVTASIPDDLAPGDTTEERLREILEEANRGDRVLGIHPDASLPVLLKSGPYGPYVQLGDDEEEDDPKRVSLPPDVEPEDVDFDLGVRIVDLPRTLGEHPDTGKEIEADIGRYGPYVRHEGTFASLQKGDDVLEVGLERALELIRRKEARNEPDRVLGPHPGSDEPVEVWNGRYGPYVKHDGTNASLKDDQSIDDVTMDDALDLLAEKGDEATQKVRE